MSSPSVIVVMPAYNEELCIAGVIRSWLTVLHDIPGSSLIVVNDGSRDGTGRVLDDLSPSNPQLQVVHKANGGHGTAILEGYARALKAGTEWIFQVDSDDQIPAGEFSRLWSRRAESGFILGYRRERHDEKNRLLISAINRAIVTALFQVTIKDPNVPFRLMHRDVLGPNLKIINRRPPFAPNIQLSILAARSRIPALDIPVAHRIRDTGVVSIRRLKLARVCLRSFFELIRFRVSLFFDDGSAI